MAENESNGKYRLPIGPGPVNSALQTEKTECKLPGLIDPAF